MLKKESFEKVIEFAQTELKPNAFRYDYPVSNELRKVMVSEVLRDFMLYSLNRYYDEYLPSLNEFVEDHDVREEKRDRLVQNLFWWRLLYASSNDSETSCIEDYIAENDHWLGKSPILISWLKECEKAVPKFYYVGHKYNENLLVVVDTLTKKNLDVIVLDPIAVPSKQGEIVMGTLIPVGGGIYFSIIDFYHFDIEATQEIVNHLHYNYYDKHEKTSSMYEAFIHVLSSILQIERFVFNENQENTSVK